MFLKGNKKKYAWKCVCVCVSKILHETPLCKGNKP